MCQLSRFTYKQLPFKVAPAGDLLQKKIDNIFNELPNVFGTAGDILVVNYDDGTDDDNRLRRVLLIYRKSKSKIKQR